MKILKLDCFIGTGIIFTVMALFPILFTNKFFDSIYNTFSDLQFTDYQYSELRTNANVDTNIIIINIKHTDNLELASVLNYINNYKPKVIGIEKILRKSGSPDMDLILKEAIRNIKNMVFAKKLINFSKESTTFNSEVLSDSSLFTLKENTGEAKLKPGSVGFQNLILGDEQGKENKTIRKFYPEIFLGSQKEIAFAALVAWHFDPDAVEKLMNRQKKSETINYRGDFRKFIFIDAGEIADADTLIFKDKIILLGDADVHSDRRYLKDLYFTPLNPRLGGRTFPDMYAPEIQANIISMILSGKYFNTLPQWIAILIAIMICYINMLILFWACDNLKMWYEIISLCIFVIESVSILYLTVILYHEYYFELNLTVAIFVSSLTVPVSEIYYESLKPLTHKFFNFIKNKD